MISIVVITYNKVKSLERCIKSLLNQSYKNYEIIIIDDGSTDDTENLVKDLQKRYKNIKYFIQKHKGRGAARNLGLRKARGDIIAFTDDDCTSPKDWLKNIKTLFESHKGISAVGGAIVNNDKNPFGEAAHILNFSSWLPTGKKRYVNDTPTANIAYKKKDIKGIRFPGYYGDLDYEDSFFNSILVKRNKKILFDPSIRMHHVPEINSYERFLKNQQRKAFSFLLKGYRLHGKVGEVLVRFSFLNLFCPRFFLIFLRCSRSPEYFIKFITYSPLIFRGELERGLTIIK